MIDMTVDAVILGGSCTDDAGIVLDAAAALLAGRAGEVAARSRNYRTPAWGFSCDSEFVNCAYLVRTRLTPEALLDCVQDIERLLGRDREAERSERERTGQRYAARRIDLDILLYGRQRVECDRLRVPHALLAQRDFALVPLAEVLGLSRGETLALVKEIENVK